MKNTLKAFSIVELIVVATILGILGMIAYISIQDHSETTQNSQIAKNLSQVTQDISNGLDTWDISNITDIINIDEILFANHSVAGEYGSGLTLWSDGDYLIGTLNFENISPESTPLQDNDGNEYIIAVIDTEDEDSFQIVGQTKNAAGSYEAVVNGSYGPLSPTDLPGLISKNGEKIPLTNTAPLGTEGMY